MQSNMSIYDEQPSVLAKIEAETVQHSKKKRQRRSMRKAEMKHTRKHTPGRIASRIYRSATSRGKAQEEASVEE